MAVGTSIPFQWAQQGSPLSDAAGAFLATQEMIQRRRERAEMLRIQNEQQKLREAQLQFDKDEAQAKRDREDAALRRELTAKANQTVADVSKSGLLDKDSPDYNPSQARALGAKVGLAFDPLPNAERAPLDSPEGALPEELPGGIPDDEKKKLEAAAPLLGMLGYSKAATDKFVADETKRRSGGSDREVRDLMMATVDASRPKGPLDEIDMLLSQRQQFDTSAPMKYKFEGPGTSGVIDPGEQRMAADRYASGQRVAVADRLGTMAAELPAEPTDLQPFTKSDVETAATMVRSGAIPTPKIENARDLMQFMAELRNKRETAEISSSGRKAAAHIAAGRAEADLGNKALQGRIAAENNFEKVVAPYQIKSGKDSAGAMVEFEALVRGAENALNDYVKTGKKDPEKALGMIKSLRQKTISLFQSGALTEGDVTRGDAVMNDFFQSTKDRVIQLWTGAPSAQTMRQVIAASKVAHGSAMTRMRSAASAARTQWNEDIRKSGALGAEGANAYRARYNAMFGDFPGIPPLEGNIEAPDIAAGKSRRANISITTTNEETGKPGFDPDAAMKELGL